MDAKLIAPMSAAEIKEAVFKIGTHQAPGLDGFPASFFQGLWDLVALDLTQAVTDSFESTDILTSLNRLGRFVAINTASLFVNLHIFFHQSRCIDYQVTGNMNGGEVDMLVDQFPVVEPNNNGNQVQPPEEIVAGNDNHQAPAEEEAVTSPDPAVGNNIAELEGCFTALDIIFGSDDDPINIEDQGNLPKP
ncbi:hypothetical protein LINPERPRIM_LOCUS17136 [Linum perenne]